MEATQKLQTINLGKQSKKISREISENGTLGGGVSDLIHFYKPLH